MTALSTSPYPPSIACERLTLTYGYRQRLPLKVDIYPFQLRQASTSSASSFPPPSPFILYLHSTPDNPFFGGSRQLVPPWLVSVCAERGWPLLSADYRLAPEATLTEAWKDVQALWAFIQDEGGMNWSIASAGGGSEADSGNVSLNEGFALLQQRGGVDATRGCLVASGSAGYMASIGGALLTPQPIALAMVDPFLNLSAQYYSVARPPLPPSPSTKRRSKRLASVLSRAGKPEAAVVSAHRIGAGSEPSIPPLAPPTMEYRPSSRESSGSKNGNEQRPPEAPTEPWWQCRLGNRDGAGRTYGRERAGLFQAVLRSGQLAAVLDPPCTVREALQSMDDRARQRQRQGQRQSSATTGTYPPVLILDSSEGSGISQGDNSNSEGDSTNRPAAAAAAVSPLAPDPSGASAFLSTLRERDPTHSAVEDLLTAGLISRDTSNRRAAAAAGGGGGELFDPRRRFLHRLVAPTGGDSTKRRTPAAPPPPPTAALLRTRTDAAWVGHWDALQAFLGAWIEVASAEAEAAAGSDTGLSHDPRRKGKRDEKL